MGYFSISFYMALHISIFNILLSFVILLHNWKVNRNSAYLAVLLFLISTFSMTHYLVLHATEPFWLALAFNNLTPIWCMIGPSLYFYIRGVLTDQSEFRKSDLLHTIPFCLTLIGVFPYLITSFDYKLSVANLIIHHLNAMKAVKVNWLIPQKVNLLVRPIMQIVYSVVCLTLLLRFYRKRKQNSDRPAKQFNFVHRWLFALTLFVLSIGIYYLWALIIYYTNPVLERKLIFEYQAVYFIGMTLIFMPLLLFIFPNILYGIPKFKIQQETSRTESRKTLEPVLDNGVLMDKGETLTETNSDEHDPGEDPFMSLARSIYEVMEEKKPYLEEDFSLEDLAELLQVPKHHLYYCFRNILQTKFTTLRTEFRIKYARQLLLKIDLRITTLDAVGKKCGFASRSAFYKTFKAEVGCSPGEYVEKMSG